MKGGALDDNQEGFQKGLTNLQMQEFLLIQYDEKKRKRLVKNQPFSLKPLLFNTYALYRARICCFLAIAGVAFVRSDDMGLPVVTYFEYLRAHFLTGTASFTCIFIYYRLWHLVSSLCI
jgi:hypothetical protein